MVLLPGCRCIPCCYPYPDAVMVDLANVVSEKVYGATNTTIQNNFGTFHFTTTSFAKELDIEGTYELVHDSGWPISLGRRYRYDDANITLTVVMVDPASIPRQIDFGVEVKPFPRAKYIQGLNNVVPEADMAAETWNNDCVQTGIFFFSEFGPDPNLYPACVARQWGGADFTQQCSAFIADLYQHRFTARSQPFAEWATADGDSLLTPFNVLWEPHPPAGFPWRLRRTLEVGGQSFFEPFIFSGGRTVTVIAGEETSIRNVEYGFDVAGIRLVYGDSELGFPFL